MDSALKLHLEDLFHSLQSCSDEDELTTLDDWDAVKGQMDDIIDYANKNKLDLPQSFRDLYQSVLKYIVALDEESIAYDVLEDFADDLYSDLGMDKEDYVEEKREPIWTGTPMSFEEAWRENMKENDEDKK